MSVSKHISEPLFSDFGSFKALLRKWDLGYLLETIYLYFFILGLTLSGSSTEEAQKVAVETLVSTLQ